MMADMVNKAAFKAAKREETGELMVIAAVLLSQAESHPPTHIHTEREREREREKERAMSATNK